MSGGVLREGAMRAAAFLALGVALLTGAANACRAAPYAAILMSVDNGEALYSDNADTPLHPASITKMMTLYLTFEALGNGTLRLTDPVPISRHAASQRPSKLGLRPGATISVDDAIRALAVKSANDIAVALAEKIDGSEDAFARHMTREAQQLGMRGTLFVNASGLPNPAHVTTARDIATLSTALIRRFPIYYRYFSTPTFTYAARSYANHNHLLGRMQGVDGIKTGYTVDAGWTLAASAQRNGHRMIAVVLGARSARDRDADAERLLQLGFESLDRRALGQPFTVAQNFQPRGAVRGGIVEVATESGDDDAAPPPRRRVHISAQPARKAGSARHAYVAPARHGKAKATTKKGTSATRARHTRAAKGKAATRAHGKSVKPATKGKANAKGNAKGKAGSHRTTSTHKATKHKAH